MKGIKKKAHQLGAGAEALHQARKLRRNSLNARVLIQLTEYGGGGGMKRSPETLRGIALWAERKADEAAALDAPWAIRNLRYYQNMASKFWGEYYAASRENEAAG